MSAVLSKVQVAEEGEELNQALMWLMFLPQALLRKPRRGGKAGRGLVAQRFNSLARGDWGKLVELWERDMRMLEEENETEQNRVESDQAKEIEKKRQVALRLLHKGQISRAVGRITSHGIADMSEQGVRDQLLSKYPVRGRQLPHTVTKGKCVDSLKGIRERLLNQKGGGSPGTGGLRSEFLKVLAEKMDDRIDLLESFGLRYLWGELPAWFY